MSAPSQPPPPKGGGGLSLYANLLESSGDASATISSAPVLYNGPAEPQPTKKPLDSALRFQPIRRPQVKQKPKPSFPKTIPGAMPSKPASSSAEPTPTSAPTAAATTAAPASAPVANPPAKSSLAAWAATGDEWKYSAALSEKRQRGGRRKKKKRQMEQMETDWEELYDPTRPTNVEEYLRSDERIREIHEWKDLLYRHRRGGRGDLDSDSDGEDRRQPMQNQFAPPPNYSFAPPPPSPPRASIPTDQSGDDAYSRRLAMSQGAPPPSGPIPPPPTPPLEGGQGITISRAPVRYSPPPHHSSDSESESYRPTLGLGATTKEEDDSEDQPRSSRPGQKGFAQRLMSKYGWTKGSGLGADESGIVNPLRVQVEKRKKKSDAEGGGWAEPAARSKILGGNRKPGRAGDDEGFGAMSEVIVLRNMLDGMDDLQGEIASGLGQEIGEECGDKYGRVERLYIDVDTKQVFIKFTDQVSALRAVNELNGRIFNGNAIQPKFYDSDRFEKGIYS